MAAAGQVTLESRMTIRAALGAARAALARSDTPDLDAQILLCHVLGVDRAVLFSHAERALTGGQYDAFQSALKRRAAGEPIAYITGAKGFYDLDLVVSPAVLIPRPETELLLEAALQLTEVQADVSVADIGTGSGALAIAFARQRPAARVYASDICKDAMRIARSNAALSGVDVSFLVGDLAQPLIKRGIQVDLLLANLPYIASEDLPSLAVSRFEPRVALDGGADGLDLIRRLLAQIPAFCRAGAFVLLEIGADQGAALTQLVRERIGVNCEILPDYAGLDRIARFQL